MWAAQQRGGSVVRGSAHQHTWDADAVGATWAVRVLHHDRKTRSVKTHDRELLVRDKQIEYLTHALTTCREAADRRADQVGELMEHSRVTTAIIRSLPEVESGEITA